MERSGEQLLPGARFPLNEHRDPSVSHDPAGRLEHGRKGARSPLNRAERIGPIGTLRCGPLASGRAAGRHRAA